MLLFNSANIKGPHVDLTKNVTRRQRMYAEQLHGIVFKASLCRIVHSFVVYSVYVRFVLAFFLQSVSPTASE